MPHSPGTTGPRGVTPVTLPNRRARHGLGKGMTEPSARPPRPVVRSGGGAAVGGDDPVLARRAAGRPVVAFLLATLALTAAGIGQATSMPAPPPAASTAPPAPGGACAGSPDCSDLVPPR